MAWSTIAFASASFETSALTKVASPPAARTRSTVSSPAASLYSATTTSAPSCGEQLRGDAAHAAAAAGDDRDLVVESHRSTSGVLRRRCDTA